MSTNRPRLDLAKKAFRQVYDEIDKSVSAVGTHIGGNVDYNINGLEPEQGQFQNACAIRLSYVLNKTGVRIPHSPHKTVSGANGNWYFYKVKDLITFLKKSFGKPDATIHRPTMEKVSRFRGIIVFEVNQWSDATGHATIWDGISCSDNCYFEESERVFIRTLK